MIAAIDLVREKGGAGVGPIFFQPEGDAGVRCRDHALARGLIMRATRDTMVPSPPLIITRAEVDRLVGIASAALDATLRDCELV